MGRKTSLGEKKQPTSTPAAGRSAAKKVASDPGGKR